MEIPSYDYPFSLQTNNLPFPQLSEGLRHRWQNWRSRPTFNRGYSRIPDSEVNEINAVEETSFNQAEPETRIEIEPFDEIIDIPETVGETTGLLSGTAAVGSIGGTAGGIGSTLGTAGVGATVALGGTALAVGGKALYDRISEKGAVLPNSEFIGPGNPIHIGAAKNPSEQAAKEHDVNYANLIEFAKNNEITQKDFSERVHQFDQSAIDEFENDWKETGNWHAFAGKYGLKVKQAVEKLYGQAIYPSHPGTSNAEPAQPDQEEQDYVDEFDLSLLDNNTPQGNQEEASLDEILDRPVDPVDHQNIVNELQNMSNGQTAMQVDQVASTSGGQNRGQKRRRTEGVGGTSLPGTAGGMGGGGMEQAVEPIPRPMYSAHTQIRHFKKVHRILTFGLAYKPIAISRPGPPPYSDVYMMTSLAHIPWEYPFMYLNPSEFALLPAGSRVKHVSCRVKAENVRIAFPTNATDSNLATLNQNKFLRVGINLNQKIQSVNAQPGGFAPAQPMIATSVTAFNQNSYQNWIDNFYGVPNNDETTPDVFTTQTPRHQFGIPWVAQYYCCPVTQTNDPTLSGWEDFQAQLEEIKVDGPSGYIAEMEYSPALGLLKAPLQGIWTGLPSTATPGTARTLPVNSGAGNTQHRRLETTITNSLNVGVTEVAVNYNRQPTAANFSLLIPIEKNQRMVSGITPEFFAKTQPTLHVGVMPVPALTTSAIDNAVNNSSFTDAQAYFEITCEMEVECAFPTRRALATIANTSMSNACFEKSGAGEIGYQASMAYGLFQTV